MQPVKVKDDSARPACRSHWPLLATFLTFLTTIACRQILGITPPGPICGDGTAADNPAACSPPTTPGCADPLLIDDFEDGDQVICALSDRSGDWFTFSDGTSTDLSTFTPTLIADGLRGDSHRAARVTGSGFTNWGAGMGVGLNAHRPYDASAAGGVSFWLKSDKPVRVEITTPDTLPPNYGGRCIDTAEATNCNQHFGHQLSASGADWTMHKLPFSAFLQRGSATWDPAQLRGIQFSVGAAAAFDLWVDDVAFYAAWCADPLLIDDMEDGNSFICGSELRTGAWWAVSDGTSTDLTPAAHQPFTPTRIPGERAASRYAARLAGSGFTGWGAQMSFHLLDGAGYDAGAARGIKFWVKSSTPQVMVAFSIPATVPASQGGHCVDDAVAHNCYNDFHFDVSVPDSDSWLEVEVPFAALRQFGGTPETSDDPMTGSATWDPSKIISVKFNPGSSFAPFETWIDDVRFYF